MDREPARRAWRRWILGTLMAGVIAAAIFTGRDQASGAPGAAAIAPLDTVVLTGSYSCSVYSYNIVPPYPEPVPRPTPDPTSAPLAEPESDDPVPVRELSHYVSISGTGASTPAPAFSGGPAAGPGVGPGFGGRPVVGALLPAPINLGSGVSAGFDGGTAEDCVRFGQAVEAAAHSLGCMTSSLRTRQGIPIVVAESRFSFVCEGPAAQELHTVGELDRAVLAQRTAP